MWDMSQPACIARVEENALLLRLLPKKLIELETRRAQHRWLGYQFLSPLECTRLFADVYRRHFRTIFYGDCDFDPEIGTPEFETLWKMRCGADACFMSYPTYLSIAFHLYRKKAPDAFRQPHLIFLKRQETLTWRKQAAKTVAAMGAGEWLHVRGMGHFQRRSYCGLPPQDALRKKARAVGRKIGWRRAVERYCIEHPVLLPSELLSELTALELKEARRDILAANRFSGGPAPEVPRGELIQTCFAWPRARFAEPRCLVCPQEEACRIGLEKG